MVSRNMMGERSSIPASKLMLIVSLDCLVLVDPNRQTSKHVRSSFSALIVNPFTPHEAGEAEFDYTDLRGMFANLGFSPFIPLKSETFIFIHYMLSYVTVF